MNYLFGKIKQKLNKSTNDQITGVKEIIQSFQITSKPFDSEEINRRLESISENCNKWTTYILNEPSMGLYFCQTHNKRCIEAKVNSILQASTEITKKQILVRQIARSNQEIKQISSLSNQWFTRICSKLDSLNEQRDPAQEQK